MLEYEAALFRQARSLALSRRDVNDLLDYLCSVAHQQSIFFLWRPRLQDANDDMVLEAAVAGGCRYIVTFNKRDFGATRTFSLRVVTPREFLHAIGVVK